MNKIIDVQGLSKSYGEIRAVQGIDFYVEEGSLFAFLGKNGAGKSTTIDMLSTRLRPDGGEVTVCGHAIGREDAAIRKAIGIVFQDGLLDGMLTVEENLLTRCALYGYSGRDRKERVKSALDTVGISHLSKRFYSKLSGGQRRAADIARALVHRPRILFLDEPTTGLDPETRRTVWDTVAGLQSRHGMTVFLTTHYMEEAARADYVTIIGQGLILDKGSPLELKNRHTTDRLVIEPKSRERLDRYIASHGLEASSQGRQVCIPLTDTLSALPLLGDLADNLLSFEVLHGTMDEAFLSVIA